MAASPERIRAVVDDYVRLVGSGTADEIVALYAEDATVEDPVGTEVRRGHAAIRGPPIMEIFVAEVDARIWTRQQSGGRVDPVALYFDVPAEAIAVFEQAVQTETQDRRQRLIQIDA